MDRLPTTPAPASHQQAHAPICFRTDADGRITIPRNWIHTFDLSAENFESIYLQTKHAFARLVALTKPPILNWNHERGFAGSGDNRLLIRPDSHASLAGRVQTCDCCSSPGRIEFRNPHGQEFLQICAPQTVPPSEWAHYIKTLIESPEEDEAVHLALDQFPAVPDTATLLSLHPYSLATFLQLLAENDAAIEVTLANCESTHRRRIQIETIELSDDAIGVYSELASFQLGLRAARSLHCDARSAKRPILYIAGPDDAQLLAIEPATDHYSEAVFSQTLGKLST
ncbi:hypothetical protein [Pelagicoccus sp. SDUM812003]|uniref:hypothetical protein n=1 Tax=Pelagicoccus sp. SDUM812003 TaxID=3041267 RepID=UPI0028103F51|nr:hypothetical protein [Pelagicoccus sp. SDUM812003]MDQ8202585.1 hypothetical protein [Pelagicoccus sp. SDUM812003]